MEFLHEIDFSSLNILLLVGLALFGGTFGGRLFQRLRIPQVVGYLAIGIAIGQSGFNWINQEAITNLDPVNTFALGLIGFTMGNELRLDVFRRFGRQFAWILFFEALTASVFVFIMVFFGAWLVYPVKVALAFALLMAPIAAATAAAGTTDVIGEFKARGILTTTILGIVALDDILALFLFALSASVAGQFLGGGGGNLAANLLQPAYEILGSVVLGGLGGLGLGFLLKRFVDERRVLEFSLGGVAVILGLSLVLKVDMIMASMIAGTILANRSPRQSKKVFAIVEGFAPPVYILFFVSVGAKFSIQTVSLGIALIAGLFLAGRSIGKVLGARWGATLGGAPDKVRKNLPLALFSQSGVAIGLSIVAAQKFPGEVGNTIMLAITTSTFIVQLLGPQFLKHALKNSGEAGRNVTRGELEATIAVREVARTQGSLQEYTSLPEVLKKFASTDGNAHTVVDDEGRPLGAVTVDSIKDALAGEGLASLLLAADIMYPVATVKSTDTLDKARPVLAASQSGSAAVIDGNGKYLSMVDERIVDEFVSKRILELEALS